MFVINLKTQGFHSKSKVLCNSSVPLLKHVVLTVNTASVFPCLESYLLDASVIGIVAKIADLMSHPKKFHA